MTPSALLLASSLAALQLSGSAEAAVSRHYLAAWTGDADRADSDFLAIIDADANSPRYGDVVATVPAGARATHPHHSEHSFGSGNTLFVSGFGGNRMFRFDLENPLRPRLAGEVKFPSALGYPHSFERVSDRGNVIVTMQARDESFQPPGGIVEFDNEGTIIRWASAETPELQSNIVRPYSLVVLPAQDRLITTSGQMGLPRWDTRRDKFAEEPWAFHLQLWRLSDLTLLRTVALSAPEGQDANLLPYEPRVLQDGTTVLVVTALCGLYLVNGVEADSFGAELVYEFEGRGCAVPVRVGKFWVQPVSSTKRVVVLDVSNPRRPVEVDRLQFDDQQGTHWLAFHENSSRIVVGNHELAEPRIRMLNFDLASGQIELDQRFRDKGSEREGVSFDRQEWPHGATGPAIPHGIVFVEPASDERARSN